MEDIAVSKRFDSSPNNLPLQVNRFIGRESEMTAVRGLLVTTRLLTLTGAGGSGKTRLAFRSQPTSWRSSSMVSGGWSWQRSPILCSCRRP